MRFMIIVRASAASEAGALPAQQLGAALAGFHEQLARAGVLLDAQGLQPSSRGWRIRWSGARQSVVDGPFTPTSELIDAYTLIQVRSREEALEWSRRFPAPQGEGIDAEIEVRQLVELEPLEPGQAVERSRRLTPDA